MSVLLPQPAAILPTSPATPVSMVLVGANFGALIARNLEQYRSFVRLSGVCDLDAGRAKALAGELGVSAHDNLDAVLADPSVEAIGLFTGPSGRARLIERILCAGKHVMTTKPFELDPGAAAKVFTLADHLGLAVHLNSPGTRPASDLHTLQGWMTRHNLGRPVSLQAWTWASYTEVADGSWRDDPAACPGGPLYRLGVYLLNDFSPLVGTPLTVHVQHARVRTGRPTADNAQISVVYDSGALGHVFASFCVDDGKPYTDSVLLACERGLLRREVVRTGAVDMSGDHAIVELQRPGEAPLRHQTRAGDYAGWYDWAAFQDAVRRKPGAIRHNGTKTVAGVRLLQAMSRAALSGKTEAVA